MDTAITPDTAPPPARPEPSAMARTPAGAPPDTPTGTSTITPAPRRLHSRDLLGQGRELEIEHAGQLYRLRLTQLGKLILTK